eukprot:gnl/TRDRNA2_/TRDRNA2_91620_c3_seq1.p1 gnl/TRDRNA2_/TRDRNA2_91620_c3~~gnl/TRDRNA2_/TRDRNA2_91620_c3_seq1.p1  ORF type:complete len:275 (+),score=67.17 gnl/TRDRNA2_/TRDRNA2_91620_c3_seq1:120-827(+)
MCDEQTASMSEIDEERGLLDDNTDENAHGCSQNLLAVQQDIAIHNRIAAEREEGIRRIQSQVSEVNSIFRDLAAIVQEQGQHIETIEQQAEVSSENTKKAVVELQKASDRQRTSRERLCYILALALLVLCCIVLRHTTWSRSVSAPDTVPVPAALEYSQAPSAAADDVGVIKMEDIGSDSTRDYDGQPWGFQTQNANNPVTWIKDTQDVRTENAGSEDPASSTSKLANLAGPTVT